MITKAAWKLSEAAGADLYTLPGTREFKSLRDGRTSFVRYEIIPEISYIREEKL